MLPGPSGCQSLLAEQTTQKQNSIAGQTKNDINRKSGKFSSATELH